MAGERIVIDGVKRVIAVASGKGGVGKSTVSVNLALALAELGYKVGLFDGDVHGPNVPLMLGVRRTQRAEGAAAYVAIAVSSEYEKKTSRSQPLERYGLKIMSIGLLVGEDQPVIPDTNLVGRMVVQMLRSVDWDGLDFLLIDLPPGTGEPQITLSQKLQLDGVVLVTTPPDVALLDTTKALNLYRDRGIEVLGLVENMSYYICPTCGDQREIFPRSEREAERAVRSESVTVLGRIPLSPAVGTAGDNGRPLLITNPEGEVAQAFLETARQLIQAIAQLPPKPVPAPQPEASASPEPATQMTEDSPQANPTEPKPQVAEAASPLPNESRSVVPFQSEYLAGLAETLLTSVRQKLAPQTPGPKRNEAGMRSVVDAYRAAWDEIGGTLPNAIQKELLTFILSTTLPED